MTIMWTSSEKSIQFGACGQRGLVGYGSMKLLNSQITGVFNLSGNSIKGVYNFDVNDGSICYRSRET